MDGSKVSVQISTTDTVADLKKLLASETKTDVANFHVYMSGKYQSDNTCCSQLTGTLTMKIPTKQDPRVSGKSKLKLGKVQCSKYQKTVKIVNKIACDTSELKQAMGTLVEEKVFLRRSFSFLGVQEG